MDLKENYIKLLLNKCIYSKNKSIFISYDKINKDFINLLIKKARIMGFDDIVVDEKDIFYERELLCNLSLEEIVNHPYFCNDSWNRAASKKYTFLLATTTFPHFFDDISEEKMLVAANTKNNGQKKYMESVMNDAISWTIFVLPNNIWAKNIFPNTANSCKKLERIIYSMCMINGNKSIEN